MVTTARGKGTDYVPPPTPKAGTMDGQLRIAYRQVTRNGAMGVDQAAFVGAHFGVDSKSMRKAYKEVGGTTITEEQFISIVKKSISQSRGVSADDKWMSKQDPTVINKNAAMLHRSLGVHPNFLPHSALPLSTVDEKSSATPSKAAAKAAYKEKTAKAAAYLESRRPQSTSLRRPGTGASRRSASAPLDAGEQEAKRPGTASYMPAFTAGGGLTMRDADAPWRWSRIDNSVPKNIRNVLLKPMRHGTATAGGGSRPATAMLGAVAPAPSGLLSEVKVSLGGITLHDAIVTVEGVVDDPNRPVSASVFRNALQILGTNISVEQAVSLAKEMGCWDEVGEGVHYKALFFHLIPAVEVLNCEEAGIQSDKFAKYKEQRKKITKTLSANEVKMLELLRQKLKASGTSAADLRQAFKYVDEKKEGKVGLNGLVQALSMRGVGMTGEDAGVLFSILDDSKRGSEVIDYNMLTAAMFPPMPDDAVRGDEVTRESRSRQMIRDRSLKKEVVKELGPGEVKKFLMNLTPEQVMRVLRNKVGVKAMQGGPGALGKWFEVFDSDGEKQITREELKELLVDFGLYLRDDQITGVMAMFGSEGGTFDQNEFVSSLLPMKQCSLTASEYELHDKESVGHVPGEGKLSGEDLKTFLKDKLMREFVKKGESAPGRQIREALARFGASKDGSMTTYELRKAFQSMGLFASNDTVETLVGCYDKSGTGHADLVEFVEDIDPSAFSYAFSVGNVAKAGTFDSIEKELKLEPGVSDQQVVDMLRETLKKRMKADGNQTLLPLIKPYADAQGTLGPKELKAALVRLGLKVGTQDNLERAYNVLRHGRSRIDMYSLSAELEEKQNNSTRLASRPSSRADSSMQRGPPSRGGVGWDRPPSRAPSERPATGASVTTVRPFG